MHLGMDIDPSDQEVAKDMAETINDNFNAMVYSQDHETSSVDLQQGTQDHIGLVNVPGDPRSQLQKQLPQNATTVPRHYQEKDMRLIPTSTRREPAKRHTGATVDAVLQRHPQPAAVMWRAANPAVPPVVAVARAYGKGSRGPIAKNSQAMREISAAEIEERKSKAATKLNTVLERARALKDQAKADRGLPVREKRRAECALKIANRQEARLRATLADPQGLFPTERKRKTHVQSENLVSDLEVLGL